MLLVVISLNCGGVFGVIYKVRHAQGVGCPIKRYEVLHGCSRVLAIVMFVIKAVFFFVCNNQ